MWHEVPWMNPLIRYSLIVMVAVPGIWRGERNDERCCAYMKALG